MAVHFYGHATSSLSPLTYFVWENVIVDYKSQVCIGLGSTKHEIVICVLLNYWIQTGDQKYWDTSPYGMFTALTNEFTLDKLFSCFRKFENVSIINLLSKTKLLII